MESRVGPEEQQKLFDRHLSFLSAAAVRRAPRSTPSRGAAPVPQS